MQPFQVLDPFFHALGNGKLIRSVVATVWRIGACLGAVVGVVYSIIILGGAFRTTEFGTVVGHVLMAAFWLAAVFCWTAIGLYRARTIAELPDGPYTVIPIVSTMLRMMGELSLTGFSLLGVGGCLYTWFVSAAPMEQFGEFGALTMMMPRLGAGGGFLVGITFLASMVVLAFDLVVLFYFLAEATVVLVDIAGNTASLRGVALGAAAAAAPRPPVVPPMVPPAPVVPKCRRCGNPLDPGATFCGSCGSSV
jgi:hypothetical protein